MTDLVAYLGTDNVLRIYASAINPDDGAPVDLSGATVTYSLKRKDNDVVVDSGSMLHMSANSPNSDGQYVFYVILADSLTVDKSINYKVTIVIDAGAGRRGQWEPDVNYEMNS